MAIAASLTSKKRTVKYRDARGRTKSARIIGAASAATRSVTVTTASGDPHIVATSGTFTAQDVGAALSGNNTNTGAARTILSVEDGTHATMSGNAAATDAVGTATTVTRTAKMAGHKIKLGSIGGSAGIINNVPYATGERQTNVIIHRRGPL